MADQMMQKVVAAVAIAAVVGCGPAGGVCASLIRRSQTLAAERSDSRPSRTVWDTRLLVWLRQTTVPN